MIQKQYLQIPVIFIHLDQVNGLTSGGVLWPMRVSGIVTTAQCHISNFRKTIYNNYITSIHGTGTLQSYR